MRLMGFIGLIGELLFDRCIQNAQNLHKNASKLLKICTLYTFPLKKEVLFFQDYAPAFCLSLLGGSSAHFMVHIS